MYLSKHTYIFPSSRQLKKLRSNDILVPMNAPSAQTLLSYTILQIKAPGFPWRNPGLG